MHGFYTGKSTQTFWWANNMDTGLGISPFSPTSHRLPSYHLSFGSATASRRLNLTNQGAHYQYKGPGEEMPAEGGLNDVKASAWRRKKNLVRRKEEPPVAKQGGWTSQSGCGDWTLSKRRTSNSCRLDENKNGERGSLVGNGSDVKLQLHQFLWNISEWLWYVVDTFPFNVFAWW